MLGRGTLLSGRSEGILQHTCREKRSNGTEVLERSEGVVSGKFRELESLANPSSRN